MSWVHPQHKRMFALLAYLDPHPSFSFAFLLHLFKEGAKNTLKLTKKHTALTSVYTYGHVCIYAYIILYFFHYYYYIIIIIFITIIYFYYYLQFGQFEMSGC